MSHPGRREFLKDSVALALGTAALESRLLSSDLSAERAYPQQPSAARDWWNGSMPIIRERM